MPFIHAMLMVMMKHHGAAYINMQFEEPMYSDKLD